MINRGHFRSRKGSAPQALANALNLHKNRPFRLAKPSRGFTKPFSGGAIGLEQRIVARSIANLQALYNAAHRRGED